MSFEDNEQQSIGNRPAGHGGGGESNNGDSNGSGDGAGMNGFTDSGEESTEGSEFVVETTKKSVSTASIVMFGVVALGAVGVWMMYQRVGGPGKASAASVSTETVQAKKSIESFLGGGSANFASMQSMLQSTERVVQQFLNYPSMTQVPLSDLHTNPFRLKIAKAPGVENDAADKRKKEEERVAMLKGVQTLKLQSIMYSEARKACLINDTMYREGEQVEEFTIERISATSVVVKGGVYRFELRMQK